MKPKLSILTPTIPNRYEQANYLAETIQQQIANAGIPHGTVEHLSLCDNKTRSIGEKRQSLVDIANGEYFAFCDDDDDISSDYVESLLEGIKSDADVITFKQQAIYNGIESIVHFGLNNQDMPFNPNGITLRAPWHICAWKKERVKNCVFGFNNYGEDKIWCLQARKRARTGFHIDKILHTYRHDAATTAAPEPKRG